MIDTHNFWYCSHCIFKHVFKTVTLLWSLVNYIIITGNCTTLQTQNNLNSNITPERLERQKVMYILQHTVSIIIFWSFTYTIIRNMWNKFHSQFLFGTSIFISILIIIFVHPTVLTSTFKNKWKTCYFETMKKHCSYDVYIL